ncbi:unnamed protein product [Rotaria sp. Silwood2]|nr:unnamed protein product [Rotaria sp. Silwood2]CAF4245248.1 unnamed protein product [Rotaria sp. Silwood2]
MTNYYSSNDRSEKEVVTTTVPCKYVPVPHEVNDETVPLKLPVVIEEVLRGPSYNYDEHQEPVVIHEE